MKDYSVPQTNMELTKEEKELLESIGHELWSFLVFALVLMISILTFMIW